MPKQLFTVTDFSATMNLEDDPSNIGQNESVYLHNLVPKGVGYLTLDRTRFCLGIDKYKAAAETHTSAQTGFSFLDTNGYLRVLGILDDSEIGYFSHNASMHTAASSYAWTTPVNYKGAGSAISQSLGKNSFFAYDGILRIGNQALNLRPSAMTNMTVSGADRYRFGSAEALTGIKLFYENGAASANEVRGCGVYYPEVAKVASDGKYVDTSNCTYKSHTIGVYAALDSNTDSEYVENDQVYFGVSLEYDNRQESPMSTCGTSVQPLITYGAGDDGKRILLDIFVSKGSGNPYYAFDERITGINLYRKINDGAWYLLYKLHINSGVIDDTYSVRSWSSYSANLWLLNDVSDLGYSRYEEYTARTQFTDYIEWQVSDSAHTQKTFNPDAWVNWSYGCLFRNMALVIANRYYVNSNGYLANRRLYISKPDQVDVFLPDNYIQVGGADGSNYTAVLPISSDRFVIFDQRYCYVINATSSDPIVWYEETKYNTPLGGNNAFAVTPHGLVFASAKGLYLIDINGQLNELSRRIRSDWSNVVTTNMCIHYDSTNNIIFIATTGRSGEYAGMQFDVERKSWTYWSAGSLAGYSLVGSAKAVIDGYGNGENYVFASFPTYGYVTLGAIVSEVTTGLGCTYTSPPFDFGDSSVVKTGKHLFVKYSSSSNISYSIYFDHSTTASITGTIGFNGSSNTSEEKIDLQSYRFRTIQIKLSVSSTTGTTTIRELSIEYTPKRPR